MGGLIRVILRLVCVVINTHTIWLFLVDSNSEAHNMHYICGLLALLKPSICDLFVRLYYIQLGSFNASLIGAFSFCG